MRQVYLTVLGIGTKQANGTFAYNPAKYTFHEKPSRITEFVQIAEMELLRPKTFDEIIVVATEKSFKFHYSKLADQMYDLGVTRITPVIISEKMSAEGQWKWFELIFDQIRVGDHLTVDLTHGYRAIPIVFSTALHFLQKAKGIKLEGVYYGAYDADRELSPIIDMKVFYVIDEWAEAVSRLVEDADARKIAAMAEKAPGFQTRSLNTEGLIDAFQKLTDAIRNVDIHNASKVASQVTDLIGLAARDASPIEETLLRLIEEKFSGLVCDDSHSGKYDRAYFRVQMEIVRILLEHKLFMQAFTVMRELIGSIGLIRNPKARTTNSEGRKQRRKGDVFVNMLQYSESEWKFPEEDLKTVENFRRFYEELKQCGIEAVLRSFLPELVKYRNGFDHGWTSKPQALENIEEAGHRFFGSLKEVMTLLHHHGVL